MRTYSYGIPKHFGKLFLFLLFICFSLVYSQENQNKNYLKETRAEYNARMKWWTDARFGLFLHWGLYSISGGEYNGHTGHSEWLRYTAEIPIKEYDKFMQQFNPVKFNADEWVKLAKEAGMKYITITTKHHDGFCLFDSKYTDFDVMSTPFKRDIMKELSDACKKYGVKMCWYYSIKDWHHPDFIPYLPWEKDRNPEGADFSRYIKYVKDQLKELLTNYGEIGMLWFDGGNSKWTKSVGAEIYNYARSLQPDILINDRLVPDQLGMNGFQEGKENPYDFGTPEQRIPPANIPGVNWESCWTMNSNWGYNKADPNWKSGKELIQLLADIVSKGGNLLLNIGPTGEGLLPYRSIERLKIFAQWMKVNNEAIYGTSSGPFKYLEYGRCTQKAIDGGTRLYLHIFDWPKNGKLSVNAISNKAKQAFLLSDPGKTKLNVARDEDALVISIPETAPDSMNSIVVLDIEGKPVIGETPKIAGDFNTFIDQLEVPVSTNDISEEIRYTLDGSIPSVKSPRVETSIKNDSIPTVKSGIVRISETSVLSIRCFKDNKPVSGTISSKFTKLQPLPAIEAADLKPGIGYKYFEGEWNSVDELEKLSEKKKGVLPVIDLTGSEPKDGFGYEFHGFVKIPKDDNYLMYIKSDDGSRLYIDGNQIIDNDRQHAAIEISGQVALKKGFHTIRVLYFQKSGGVKLNVSFKSATIDKQLITEGMLYHSEKLK
jgi:alpha-L-fucosidase